MKLFLKPAILIFFLALSKGNNAQTENVRFDLFSGVNGVTLGKINGMVRDKYGFLWFSDQSNRCIIRFDGSHMVRYQNDPQNPNSLGGYYPECLAADSSGNIWIGFYGMGLDKFDPVANKFTHYQHSDKDAESLGNDLVSAVLADHSGNIWVGNFRGLDVLDQKTGTFKHFRHKNNDANSLSCDTVRALYEDKAGNLWAGTGFAFVNDKNGGLNLFHRDQGTFTRYMHDRNDSNSLIANKVRAIFEDSYGNFWVGTEGDGLHTMDRRTGKFTRYSYIPSKTNRLSRTSLKGLWDHITFITEDADRKIWIGTLQNGLIRYDPVSKQVTHYGSNDDKKGLLKDPTSWWANATPDGFIWISTQNANLFTVDIHNTTIPFYGRSNGFSPDAGYARQGVGAFNGEGDSVLWLGTERGLIRKDLKNSTTRQFMHDPRNANSVSSDTIYAIVKDKDNFWLGTNKGLNYFNTKTERFTRYYPDSINKASASNIVYRLCKDNNSNLWLGTYGGGLYMLDPATNGLVHYKNDPTDDDFIQSLLIDGNDLWVGNDINNGLDKFNRTKSKVSHYLFGLGISCMYKDADGTIWAGTLGGLYHYNKKTDNFSSIAEDNPGNDIVQIEAITADKEDNLWMSTETGIYMLNKKRDHVVHFGKEYGLPSANNFFFDGSSFTGQDGTLYFGNGQGYYAFLPAKLKVSIGAPKVYFTGFWLNNKQILPDSTSILKHSLYNTKEIRLHYDQNVFAFSATSVDFRNANDKKIYYKLENYDVDWRIAQPEDKITYFKVPGGNYSFRIKTSNTGNDGWVERSIDIIILPPWWTTWWAYCIYGILFCVLVVFIHRYQKARIVSYERERSRAKELAQAKEIEKAYNELKTTQTQLIQQEKMASLGELTAGIAHEIQNPLNFVNNFSEVNKEMLVELHEEINKGNYDDAKSIAKDVIANEEKINHHGKRADAIVKGMLQHTRTSSGQKELTDINALCDEYLRLAYHGLRAKDKSFSAKFETDFDPSVGKINIVPQDIGRVLLNLINNAFYAVSEKQKTGGGKFEPCVSVQTKKINEKIEIKVCDNGNGIPKNVADKIFQPFFTTKPTGQGTGLGLSLAYDIIKAHGGEIKVETKENEGSEFIVKL
jgi:signal transduction histidine kinase/ligand-binding sensor domain-containing protein